MDQSFSVFSLITAMIAFLSFLIYMMAELYPLKSVQFWGDGTGSQAIRSLILTIHTSSLILFGLSVNL